MAAASQADLYRCDSWGRAFYLAGQRASDRTPSIYGGNSGAIDSEIAKKTSGAPDRKRDSGE